MKRITFIAVALTTSLNIAMGNTKTVVISNDPVDVSLPVGSEIRVEFPEPLLNLNIQEQADAKLNTFVKPDGVVYWTASDAIAPSRVIATTNSGEVILLDISTGNSPVTVYQLTDKVQPTALPQPIRPGAAQAATTSTAPAPSQPAQPEQAQAATPNNDPYRLMPPFLREQYNPAGSAPSQAQAKTYSYADMAAFAMQHYIGPSRLISDLPAGEVKVKWPKSPILRVWKDRIHLKPLNGWVIGDHYITAIRAKNVSHAPYEFDPRALRGNLAFVASLSDVLPPMGSAQNETIWVIITQQPFHESF